MRALIEHHQLFSSVLLMLLMQHPQSSWMITERGARGKNKRVKKNDRSIFIETISKERKFDFSVKR